MSKPSKTGSGGGGYGSKVHVEPGYRTGHGATRQIPAGVSQAGQAQGSHVMTGTESGSGDTGYHGVKPDAGVLPGLGTVPLGNAKAEELSGSNAGCGKGRTIYKSGQQQGLVDRAMPQGREIFPGFSGKGKG